MKLDIYVFLLALITGIVDLYIYIYITTGRDVALWKPTNQSSTYSEAISNRMIKFSSDKAVDGSGDGNIGNLSCTRTAIGQGIQTWNVNLGKAYSIIAIKVANRNDNRKYATFLFYILHIRLYGISPLSF